MNIRELLRAAGFRLEWKPVVKPAALAGPPKMRSKLAITDISRADRMIWFDCDYIDSDILLKYGDLFRMRSMPQQHLKVDARYDFDEVVEFVSSMAEPLP